MPKLSCPCGYVHNLSPIPDAGWKTIRDTRYEDFEEACGHLAHMASEASEEKTQWLRRRVGMLGLLYECPECGRIMWRPEGEADFRVYTLERRPW